MSEHILVIGATLLDTKGKPTAGLEPGTSNPAYIRTTRGGTARNVAENLGRLGADVYLLTAVGKDLTGEQLIAQTADAGVDVAHVLTIDGENTGVYMALLEEDGSLSVALDDVQVMMNITPAYLREKEALFREAAMIMMDACIRLLPGVMGNENTAGEESFSESTGGLLEYPHYTRPAEWNSANGQTYMVPDVLKSGDHGKIAAWRQEQAEKLTRERRPDLLAVSQGKNE